MIAHGSRTLFISAVALLTFTTASWADGSGGGVHETLGPRFSPRTHSEPPRPRAQRRADTLDRLRYWNEVMLDANALDHTPVAPGEDRVFGEQVGPGRTSKAFAIVHIAIFDAVNAIVGGYRSYTGLDDGPRGASLDAA